MNIFLHRRLILLAFSLIFFNSINAQLIPSGKAAFKTQLHLHAPSNHNGANQPASMQWHNQQADSFGVNAIFWTDHYNYLKQLNSISFSFKYGVVDTSTLVISGMTGTDAIPKTWIPSSNYNSKTTSITDSSITLKMLKKTGYTSSGYFSYVPRSNNEVIKGTRTFIKSVATHPVFDFYLTPQGLTSPGTSIKLIIPLSWHNHGKQAINVLIYNFVDSSKTATTVLSTTGDTVTVRIPVYNNVSQHIVLPLEVPCKLFVDSLDNTITDYQLRLENNNGRAISAKFSKMTLTCTGNYNADLFNYGSASMTKLSTKYNIKNYFATEFTGTHGNFDHVNGYIPKSNPVYSDIVTSTVSDDNQAGYINFIHNSNGVGCYNHAFGSDNSPLYSSTLQDYREDTLFTYLVNNRIFGCDLFEIYRVRGHTDLTHHLRLWDRLTARGIYSYAVGANDKHGDGWKSTYISWIWSKQNSSDSLIAEMKRGHIYFGDISAWSGSFNFMIGTASMGDRVNGYYKKGYLKTYMSPSLNGMKLKMTQCRIDTTSNSLVYIKNDTLINLNDSVLVDLSKASFIRLTVYNSNGTAVLFSNPIVFKTNGTHNFTGKEILDIPVQSIIVEVMPNPFTSIVEFNVKLVKPGKVKMYLYDESGRIVKVIYEGKSKTDCLELFPDLSELKHGLYILKTETDSAVDYKKLIRK